MQELWERASEYPLFGTLHELSAYHFACVSQRSETLELMDETKCLQEINPFLCVLKVVERKGNETEKLLNLQIGQLIGKGIECLLFFILECLHLPGTYKHIRKHFVSSCITHIDSKP